MSLFLSPVCNDQTFDANGDPLNGGQIETYLAGSSTPAATYTDDTGNVQQSNPIILNSLGWPTLGPIWLTEGVAYKFIIKDADGATLRTIDDISGVNDASVSQSEWVASGFVPTYIDATNFSVPGDQTAVLQVNRRLRTTNTAGLVFSTITNSVFAAGITTVTVVNDSGSLDAGLSAVAYGLLSADDTAIPDLPFSKITGTVPISQGGTGQTTAVAARAALEAARDLQPISASVGSNALTITLNPTNLDFRSATLGSGTVNTRNVPAAISVVVSSGSTLGTANGVAARLAVLAIDNAGTVELAVVNMAGLASFLDESTLISTTAEGGAGGADTAGTIYSATARSNVPFRIVGFIESTQATAGTWATAPSKIQGVGGLLAAFDAGRSELAAAVTLTNQTSVDFSNIPADVNEIIMTLNSVSTNGTAQLLVQIGSSSTPDTSGYTGGVSNTSPAITNNSSGFIFNNNVAAANVTSATIVLVRHSGNTWCCSSIAFVVSTRSYIGAGEKTLSGPLVMVRLTTAGSDQYDGGTVNVLVRRG